MGCQVSQNERELQLKDSDSSAGLPQRCHGCIKSAVAMVHERCEFCLALQFEEGVLCDLNRAVQEPSSFQCHAFQPKLEVIGKSAEKAVQAAENKRDSSSNGHHERLFETDEIKYARALALQRLNRDPDGVYLELNYHIAWNVVHRARVFRNPPEDFESLHGVFSNYSDLAGGFVTLLYLAPDHIHLYVVSDGERSIEAIVQEVKGRSENDLQSVLHQIAGGLRRADGLWDDGYFAETVS